MKIHDAARAGDGAALRKLLAAGKGVDARDAEGNTPFMLAARHGHVEALALLRDAKADLHVRNAEGDNALMLATRAGQPAAIRWLLENGADAVGSAPNGFNALLLATEKIEVLETFALAGVDLNQGNPKRGLTPLMFAAQAGNKEAVRFLLQSRADANLKDNLGMTAADRAKRSGHADIVKLLQAHMAPAAPKKTQEQKQAERKLCKAAAKGKIAEIEALLAAGVPVDARDSEDYTPLMRAAEHGKHDVFLALIRAGADVKARTDSTKIDALYIACVGGHLAMVRELLARGAVLDALPEDSGTRYTPLMASVLSNNLDLVRFLVEAGADVLAEDFSNRTAYHWAREQKAKAIQRYLKEQGGGPKPRETRTGPVPEPVAPKDPGDVMQVARAEKRNFPIAASKPAFQAMRKMIAKVTSKIPVESSKRPGVYLLALGRKALSVLAEHLELPAPTFRKRTQNADAAATCALLSRLQDDVRAGGFLLMVESILDLDEPVKLWLYPTSNPYAVLSACGTNGANYGITTRRIVEWMRDLGSTHPWILTQCANDHFGGDFVHPIPDPKALAKEMYEFCPDIVDQGTETVAALARGIQAEQNFYFWWD